ncbi:MAG: UDP-2,3-diacylglucosamine diphosphatase [Proteobacteria bacterium]|nr:UDP-2,3-diacylglucosamine diphosphatase [Pseudomonadota bacterium]
MAPVLFISDLHLSADRPGANRLFFDFLEQRATGASALYILGDLFEYWAGDDDCDDPFNNSVIDALAGLAEHGVATYFMAGNRDFLAGGDFSRRAGLTILPDPTTISLFGIPTLLMHGDTLCIDDHEYMAFRTHIRSARWTSDFLSKPLQERKAIIGGLRRQSEDLKRGKDPAIMDVNTFSVDSALAANGYPRLIHGHTHRPMRHEHRIDGHSCERWVLADWYEHGGVLVCDATGCRLETV